LADDRETDLMRMIVRTKKKPRRRGIRSFTQVEKRGESN
jgi:hypothetical protein